MNICRAHITILKTTIKIPVEGDQESDISRNVFWEKNQNSSTGVRDKNEKGSSSVTKQHIQSVNRSGRHGNTKMVGIENKTRGSFGA